MLHPVHCMVQLVPPLTGKHLSIIATPTDLWVFLGDTTNKHKAINQLTNTMDIPWYL
jgi:hypothetical protein